MPTVFNGIVLETSGEYLLFNGFKTFLKWDGKDYLRIEPEKSLRYDSLK